MGQKLTTMYEDIQVNIMNASRPASSYPTERLYAHGIGGGITFPTLGFALNDYIYFAVQTRHAMELMTTIDQHIHYCTPTDGTGTKFRFRLDVIYANVDKQWAVPTGSPFYAQHDIASDYSTYHKLFDLADIPAVNNNVSTLYKCKLTRVAIDGAGSEYSGEIYIDFTDGHYKRDSNGSTSETTK